MVTCPKCGKVLEDGTKFCEICGAQIPEKVFCSSCGAENDAQCAFCQTCGAKMAADVASEQAAAPAAPVKEKKNPLAGVLETVKKLPKKIWMFAGVGVVAVVAIVVVLSLLLGGSKKQNVALYIKDGEIYYNQMKKKAEPMELTEKLINSGLGSMVGNLSNMGERLGYYIRFNKDGSKIFYPDRIDESGMTLYYRNPNKPKAEPVKIDSGLDGYIINEAGTKILYQKDGGLYLHNLKDKEKIASDVSGIHYTKDLSKVIYSTYDDESETGNVYLWKSGEDNAEKIASDIKSLRHVSEDLSVIYYTKEEGTEEESATALYKQIVDKDDKEKIASEIAGIIHIYDSGEAYYTKAVKTEKTLMDYVEDDLAANDAALTEPKAPEYPKRGTYPTREKYPEYPSRPYRYQFDNNEDYEAAYAEYEKKLEEYNQKKKEIDDAYAAAKKKIDDAYTAAKEQYNKDYAEYRDVLRPAWNEKNSRDNLRENLKEAKLESVSYTLYYYNGKESTVVTEAMSDSYATEEADEKAVLVISTEKAAEVTKIKISEADSTWDVREKVEDALDTEAEMQLVIGTTLSVINQEAATDMTLSEDGSVLYFLDDVDEEKKTGDLYKVEISKDKADARKKIDSDVYYSNLIIVWDTSIAYAKNMDSNKDKGDLYVDGEEIDFDVDLSSIDEDEGKVLRFYKDYNSDKRLGTLMQYKDGKLTQIADDVFSYVVQPNGDILYLSDYSATRYRGTLYRYAGGKATQIDEDVTSLIPILSVD